MSSLKKKGIFKEKVAVKGGNTVNNLHLGVSY